MPDETETMVLALASLETECPCLTRNPGECIQCGDVHYEACQHCHGAAKVPLVPGLRVACPDDGWVTGVHPAHCACGARRWDPVSAQAAAGALIESHYFLALAMGGDDWGHPGYWVRFRNMNEVTQSELFAEHWEDAVIAAAHAALVPAPEPVTGGE